MTEIDSITELMELKVGTMLYNRHSQMEGEIAIYYGEKCVAIYYPIESMHYDDKDKNNRPDAWSVMDI